MDALHFKRTVSIEISISKRITEASLFNLVLCQENVSIHAKTGHGRIDIFGERNSRTVIGAGEHTIRLKSDNGRITVK